MRQKLSYDFLLWFYFFILIFDPLEIYFADGVREVLNFISSEFLAYDRGFMA